MLGCRRNGRRPWFGLPQQYSVIAIWMMSSVYTLPMNALRHIGSISETIIFCIALSGSISGKRTKARWPGAVWTPPLLKLHAARGRQVRQGSAAFEVQHGSTAWEPEIPEGTDAHQAVDMTMKMHR